MQIDMESRQLLLTNGRLVLPDRVWPQASMLLVNGLIADIIDDD